MKIKGTDAADEKLTFYDGCLKKVQRTRFLVFDNLSNSATH